MRNKNYFAEMELINIVHKVCESHQLNYTLLFKTALSAKETGDMQDWVINAELGLFHTDFCKLISYLQEELPGDRYYVVTYKNDNNLEELYAKFCKKSNIVLPQDRKKDEKYYDFAIRIYPIFYAGNTIREYKKFERNFFKNKKIIDARIPVPDSVCIKNALKKIREYYLYHKQKKYDMNIESLYKAMCNNDETKYVFIPQQKKLNSVTRRIETYRETSIHKFGETQCRYMDNIAEWTDAYFNKKEQKDIITTPVNRAVLEGPEILRRVQKISLEIMIEFDRICRENGIKYIISAGTLLGAVRHKGFIPWDDDIDVFILEEDWQKFLDVAPGQIDTERFFIRTQDTDKDNNLVFGQIKRNGTIYSKGNRSQFKTHRGVFIDILPLYNGSEYWIVHKLQDMICKYYKTKVWAHMGASSEKNRLKRIIYLWMQKGDHKKNVDKYYHYAKMIKKRGDYLTYLNVKRNPFHKGFNKRSMFEKRTEYEFEGHMFYGPSDYDDFLSYCYSKDYMRYPRDCFCVNHHMPADIDLGELYKKEEP